MANTYIEVIVKGTSGYRRIFWIRESGNPPGLRCGLIGKDMYGGHTTHYHDGSAHVESKSGILSEFDYIIPSNENADYLIVSYSSIYPGSFASLPVLTEKSRNADKIIEVNESLIDESVWANVYLAKKDKAHNVLEGLLADTFTKKRGVIHKEIFELNHSAEYSLIVLILNEPE